MNGFRLLRKGPFVGFLAIRATTGCTLACNMTTSQPPSPVSSPDANIDKQTVAQTLSLLYTENAKVAATFWEWRHKVMERFFTALAGIVVGGWWIYHEGKIRGLLFLPLLFGAMYSAISYLMDRVNRKILLGCYETGKDIEQKLGVGPGAYTRILDKYGTVNYTVFLRILYLCTAGVLLLASVLAEIFVK
jgi:hypothetical protein